MTKLIRSQANIIVTRTPLRISLAGGGTDLPDFYQNADGAVLSTAINQYIYVTVKSHGKLFPESYRLNYSESEIVYNFEDIKNAIAKECFRMVGIEPPIYASTIGDLPANSGLGSSSSFAVGLLNALYALKGEAVSAGHLAEEAAYIEMEILKRPIGKQDHYAAAFGGMNYFRFKKDGGVSLEPQFFPEKSQKLFFDNLMTFWTEIQRDAGSVLKEQKANTPNKMDSLIQMRDQADALRSVLKNNFTLEEIGKELDQNWQLKRKLAGGISSGQIDEWYDKAIAAGAYGGKLCGAGGGGFLIFIVPPERREAVRATLSMLKDVPIGYEPRGSQISFME